MDHLLRRLLANFFRLLPWRQRTHDLFDLVLVFFLGQLGFNRSLGLGGGFVVQFKNLLIAFLF